MPLQRLEKLLGVVGGMSAFRGLTGDPEGAGGLAEATHWPVVMGLSEGMGIYPVSHCILIRFSI